MGRCCLPVGYRWSGLLTLPCFIRRYNSIFFFTATPNRVLICCPISPHLQQVSRKLARHLRVLACFSLNKDLSKNKAKLYAIFMQWVGLSWLYSLPGTVLLPHSDDFIWTCCYHRSVLWNVWLANAGHSIKATQEGPCSVEKARVKEDRWGYVSKILGIGCSEDQYKWNFVGAYNCP